MLQLLWNSPSMFWFELRGRKTEDAGLTKEISRNLIFDLNMYRWFKLYCCCNVGSHLGICCFPDYETIKCQLLKWIVQDRLTKCQTPLWVAFVRSAKQGPVTLEAVAVSGMHQVAKQSLWSFKCLNLFPQRLMKKKNTPENIDCVLQKKVHCLVTYSERWINYILDDGPKVFFTLNLLTTQP